MIRKTTFILFLLITNYALAQRYIDMSEALANVRGNLIIDGNTLQHRYHTSDQIIITGKNMVLNNRSSFLFNNVIVQLSGEIIVRGKTRPKLMNSHIICKRSKSLKSKNIHEIKNQEHSYIGSVEYIKNLKGNPELWVYDVSGKRVFKGTKKDARSYQLPISTYDVKVVGVAFKSNILFIN